MRLMAEDWLAIWEIIKTLEVLKEHFIWPKMLGDVTNIVGKYVTCQITKSSFKPGLYSPFPVDVRPCSIDFVIALPQTQRG